MTSIDEPLMADSRPASTDAVAAAAHDVGGREDWELLPGDGGDCKEEQDTALREAQTHCTSAQDESIKDNNEGRESENQVGGFPVWLPPWTDVIHWIMYAVTFGCLPLIAVLHLRLRYKRPAYSSSPTGEPWTAVVFMFMAVVHVAMDIFMHAVTEWMKRSNLGGSFGAFLHVKLLFRLALFVPAEIGATVLASGIQTTWAHFVKALTMDAEGNYIKCLGSLGSLALTLAYLHSSNASVASTLWREQLSQSREGVLRAGACLYEILSSSENGEPIQIYHDNLGQHVQSFMRENGAGACLWVLALCVILLEVVALSKILLDDVIALVALYKECEMEQRRGAATWSEAFQAGSLKCLQSTHYPLVARFMRCFAGVSSSIFTGLQQPSSRP